VDLGKLVVAFAVFALLCGDLRRDVPLLIVIDGLVLELLLLRGFISRELKSSAIAESDLFNFLFPSLI
jgi:hypothetical protein